MFIFRLKYRWGIFLLLGVLFFLFLGVLASILFKDVPSDKSLIKIDSHCRITGPKCRSKSFDIGIMGSVYAGQEFCKVVPIINSTKKPLEIKAKTMSCSCIKTYVQPNPVKPQQKTELKITLDTKDGSYSSNSTKQISVLLTASPDETEEYRLLLTGMVEIQKSVFVNQSICFGRPKTTMNSNLNKTLNVHNYSDQHTTISFRPLLSDIFELSTNEKVFKLSPNTSIRIPATLTSSWTGQEKVEEFLTYTIALKDASWSGETKLSVYPRLPYRAEPPSLLIGTLDDSVTSIQRVINVIEDNGEPCTSIKNLVYDENAMSIKTHKDGRLEVSISPSAWKNDPRREILVKCGEGEQIITLQIPVIVCGIKLN